MKNSIIIAFSTIREFPSDQLASALSVSDNIYIVSPYDFHDKFRKLYKSLVRQLCDASLLPKENDTSWATIPKLASHIAALGYENNLRVIKPSLFQMAINVPQQIVLGLVDSRKVVQIANLKKKKISILGLDCTGYLLDSLQRYGKINLAITSKLSSQFSIFIHILLYRLYLAGISRQIDSIAFDSVILNHMVYMESGFLSAYINKKHKSILQHMQSKQKQLECPSVGEYWFEKNVWSNYSTAIKRDHIAVIGKNSLPWYDQNSLSSLPDLTNAMIDERKFLIVMHAFSDANYINDFSMSLFQTYYSWIKFTLEIAKQNLSAQFIFRSHPLTHKYYKSDLKMISTLFANSPDHIQLSDPRTTGNSILDTDGYLPIVITFKGSIALEMACSGRKAITIGTPHAPPGTYLKMYSSLEYKALLLNQSPLMYEKESLLSDEDRKNAMIYKHCYTKAMR